LSGEVTIYRVLALLARAGDRLEHGPAPPARRPGTDSVRSRARRFAAYFAGGALSGPDAFAPVLRFHWLHFPHLLLDGASSTALNMFLSIGACDSSPQEVEHGRSPQRCRGPSRGRR
jgi:hypothetical protein